MSKTFSSVYFYIYWLLCVLNIVIIFKTGSTLKWCNALGFGFTALTHFSVTLYMYNLALKCTCCYLWIYRNNWQNSHRFGFQHSKPYWKVAITKGGIVQLYLKKFANIFAYLNLFGGGLFKCIICHNCISQYTFGFL